MESNGGELSVQRAVEPVTAFLLQRGWLNDEWKVRR
jgi:hypothetical protein